MNDFSSTIMATILLMVNNSEDHACIFGVDEISDVIELEEMHTTLLTDFNIKSEKILGSTYLYYLGTLSEDAEKALITDAKIQYYVDNCQ